MDDWQGNSSLATLGEESRNLLPKDLEQRDLLFLVLLDIIICLAFLVGVVLNTVLVILFCKRRSFRTLSNRYSSRLASCFHPRFVLNLAICNLVTCLLVTPLTLLDQLLGSFLSTPGTFTSAQLKFTFLLLINMLFFMVSF